MDDQDEPDLGVIGSEAALALDRRLRQQGTQNDDDEDPFGNDDSESSTIEEQVTSSIDPKQIAEDKDDIKLDLSDDDDTVIGLKVDDSSLSLFAKRVHAANAHSNDGNDEPSNADPFENLTDSDAPVKQLKQGEFDISSAIHSQAERGEFNIDKLIEHFRAAQRAHEELFGNILLHPHVQTMLSPQLKVVIPKQVQIQFVKYCDSPSSNAARGNILDSYKAMISACVEQHLQAVTNANRRRSFGTKRRLYSRTEDLDLSDAQAYMHSFLNALLAAYSELLLKSEKDQAQLLIAAHIKSVKECIAEAVAQFQSEINVDRASRIDSAANLEAAITARLNRIEDLLVKIGCSESPQAKGTQHRQFSSDSKGIPQPSRRQTEAASAQAIEKKTSCDPSRWLILFLQLCIVVLLLEIFHFGISSVSRARQPFLS